jgi:cytochrome c551/c552
MKNETIRTGGRWSSALVLLLTVTPLVAAGGAAKMEGNPFQGRKLLTEKLCTECHAVWGHGGFLGPDLATAVSGKGWLDLVGDFWNHTPRMIDEMSEKGNVWPNLDRREMADLLSYLYYLRLFDEPGDPQRGSAIFARHQCSRCHNLAGKGGTTGGSLDDFSAYPSPVILAQAMWNSGPTMQQEQLERGAAIPIFSHDEMAHLQAFIRAEGIRQERQVVLLPLPDPSRGATVFRDKRCDACHPSGGGVGPELSFSARDKTVSEISGILWNHNYAMNDMMRSRGIPFPRLQGTEMADMISYLYFLSFIGEEGRPEEGETVFRDRGCAACHAGPGPDAVDLAESRLAADPVALSSAMWNHAPEMHILMAEKGVAWPKFYPGDMVNLAAYLKKIAAPPNSPSP